MLDDMQASAHPPEMRREAMRTPDDVSVMLRLHELGWGLKRIALELGCSRNTVRRYLAQGGWQGCQSRPRVGQLDGLQGWLEERFWRHRGNADVLRQELLSQKALTVPVRTEAAKRSTSSQCAVIRRSSGRPAMNGASAGQFEAGPKP